MDRSGSALTGLLPAAGKSFRLLYRRRRPHLTACMCVLAALFVCAMFTGKWFFLRNGYPSYALQANAWVHGRLDLGQDYPWLELAIFKGRYYVSFPPFPSYVLAPFAVFFGADTPDGLISLAFTLWGVWAAVSLALETGKKEQEAVFWSVFLYLGTGYLFIALTPAVWFFAQVMSFTLCMVSILCAYRGQGGRSLLCWACAVGCRPMTLLFLPVLCQLLYKRERERFPKDRLSDILLCRWYWALGPLVLGASYMALNWLRFGNALEFGHNYLPEFMRSPEGQFSWSYLKNNLPLLFRLPALGEDGIVRFATFDTSLFVLMDPLSVPILLSMVLPAGRKKGLERALLYTVPVLSAIYILFLCSHRTLGGWQFGNRYLKDVLPFLYLMLMVRLGERKWLDALARVLCCFGVCLQIIGCVATFNGWI